MTKRRHPIVIRPLCDWQHTWYAHGYGRFGVVAHRCPARAMQAVIKARGYRAEFDDGALLVHTTKKQYARLFGAAERAAIAKHKAWTEKEAERESNPLY